MGTKTKAFFDSNVLIYAFLENEIAKGDIALELIKNTYALVSTQVINECANVFIKKAKATPKETKGHLTIIKKFCEIQLINVHIIDNGLELMELYGYSYYDSLILASALASGCKVVYSEDMQDGQIIDGMQIINPFHL